MFKSRVFLRKRLCKRYKKPLFPKINSWVIDWRMPIRAEKLMGDSFLICWQVSECFKAL